jgi:multisubunit Na+/H+ antiporter MnhB subunit
MLARGVTLLAMVLGAVLVAAIATMPTPPMTLAAAALAATPASGVQHPVTAVLLAFRAYDTLLEMAVVLLAVRVAAPIALPPALTIDLRDPISGGLLRVLVPFILVVAVYLLWAGTKQPGGAFAAGALVAGAGVALRLGGVWTAPLVNWRWRTLQSVGLAVFVVLGSAPLFVHGPWLSAPADWSAAVIFTIEAALTVSIAAGLVSLFASSPYGTGRDFPR